MKRKTNRKSINLGKLKADIPAWLILLPSMLLLYFIVWRPIAEGIALSFFELKGFEPVEFIGFENYKTVLRDTLFLKTLWNTLSYVGWSLVIGFFVPVILAISLNEVVHGRGTLKFAFYLPVVVPAVAASLIWYFIYQPGEAGLLNTLLINLGFSTKDWLQNANLTIPLIVISSTWKGCGSTMLLYLATLQGINQELYEAARVDGASVWKRLIYITLPQLAPTMILLFVQQIIGIFQIMSEPMVMTGGGPNNASVSLALRSYDYMFTLFKTGNALALSVITFIILLIINLFYFKVEKKLDVY